jgi:sulfhydrogenase subunit alpha
MTATREFPVRSLTRVEGGGRLRIRACDGRLDVVAFDIYEPPRFFERLLRGRSIHEVPDIVARICGICPVSYQITACVALESALGVAVPPGVVPLRRLLACGEWIQSHAIHVHVLHAPDFLGCDSCFAFPPPFAGFLDRGLRMKAAGSRIVELVGGRAVHPVNLAVGGFHRAPAAAAIRQFVPELEWGLDAALAAIETVSHFPFARFEQPYEYVSLVARDEYPMNDGRIVSRRGDGAAGLDIPIAEHGRHFVERDVPHGTARTSFILPGDRTYLCGPLARLGNCLDRLPPATRRAAESCGIVWPSPNVFHSIVARSIEIAAAFEEALAIARDCRADVAPCRAMVPIRAGAGCHATEAPRGLLFQDFTVDADGLVAGATIIPPTGRNQARIEADLRAFLPPLLALPDAAAALECERLIRAYDPCISCAAHFLDLRIDRA